MSATKARILLIGAVGVLAIVANSQDYTHAQSGGTTVYLPLICRSNECWGTTPVGGDETSCGNNPYRGELYHDLYYSSIDLMQPIANWASDSCCSVAVAQAKGEFVGNVFQLIPTIAYKIIAQFWDGLTRSISLLSSIVSIMSGNPTGYYVDCTADAEMFCFGLGAVMALDDMAGGWVTALVTLVVAILGFYLVLYVIGEVRAMLQPGDVDAS